MRVLQVEPFRCVAQAQRGSVATRTSSGNFRILPERDSNLALMIRSVSCKLPSGKVVIPQSFVYKCANEIATSFPFCCCCCCHGLFFFYKRSYRRNKRGWPQWRPSLLLTCRWASFKHAPRNDNTNTVIRRMRVSHGKAREYSVEESREGTRVVF